VLDADRHVTNADHLDRTDMMHCLSDDAGRVRVVDQPGVRATFLHFPRNIDENRNGPERHREPARAGRLLTDDVILEGHGLVDVSPGETTDANLT
jgi:hypothetical protein